MRVAIGLGSSMGDRRACLGRAVSRLACTPGSTLIAVSRWYASPPMVGGSARGWFLNGVALLDSALPPEAWLVRCRALEAAAGRRRAQHWGDRTLDLDLLVVEGATRASVDLTLPHPGIASRPFVYRPLTEVWPDALPSLSTLPADPPGIVPVGVFAHPRGPAYQGSHPARWGGAPRGAERRGPP